jgi:MFS family permease
MNDTLRYFLYRAVVIVGSGGLIFGYDIGVISGTLPSIKDDFNLSGYEEGLVVSILYAGSIIGSIFGGPLCDSIGRWKTIQFQNLVFIFGALLTGLAPNLSSLCVGRFFVGVASAISGLADVPYLTEIAPAEYRGILSGQYEILVGAGILLSFILDLAFVSFSSGWRIAFLLPGIFALLQSFGLFLLPESPKWLKAKGRHDEAKKVLILIYGEEEYRLHEKEITTVEVERRVSITEGFESNSSSHPIVTSALHSSSISAYQEESRHNDADNNRTRDEDEEQSKRSRAPLEHTTRESSTISPSHNHDKHEHSSLDDFSHAITDLLSQQNELLKEYRYSIFVIIMIQILSQITGANIIRNYAPTIFEDSGVSEGLALFYNVLLGIIKLLFTIIAVVYIESTGRRKFLLFGIFWVTIGMLFLTIASLVSSDCNLNNPVLFVIGCSFVYAGFGFGYGPIPWVLSSEMVPTIIRGRVLCISLIASNLTQLIMNFLFIPMSLYMTSAGTFGTFLVLNIITFYYSWHFIVETKEILPSAILIALKEKYNGFKNASWTELYCLCFAKRNGAYTELCLE